MKIIFVGKVKPWYSFPEFEKKIQRGYVFYLDNDLTKSYRVVLRIGNYILIRRI